jgi:hypothetical protein
MAILRYKAGWIERLRLRRKKEKAYRTHTKQLPEFNP